MTRRPILSCLAAALICIVAGGCAQDKPDPAHATPASKVDGQLHNALPASIRDSGVLRVGTDAAYAPASSFAADGRTIIGFEPDLGVELGRVLGVRVVFSNHVFVSLSNLVSSHGTDMVMSAMTDTKDREKKIDFVDYFSAGSSIVVQRGNPAGIADVGSLCGHVVALERGTVQVDLVARAQHNCAAARPIVIHLYNSNTDALVQLRTGQAAAVLNDYPPAAALVSNARTGTYYQLASTAQYEPGPYGIGVAKDQPQLRDTIARAMQRIMKDGSYAEVLTKWGVSAGAVAIAAINDQH